MDSGIRDYIDAHESHGQTTCLLGDIFMKVMSTESEDIRRDSVSVRPVLPGDLDAVSRLHIEILSDEFIVRFGLRFLKRYYRAFAESSHAVALVAVDDNSGAIVGGLLGTLNPSLHYRYLIRYHGVYLAGTVVLRSLTRWALARDFLRTRIKRYALGVMRSLFRHESQHSHTAPITTNKVADLTHLFVSSPAHSKGIGSSLMRTYTSMVRRGGIQYIDLVTLPSDLGGAGSFYEKLGCTLVRKHVSQSGEVFLLYRLVLDR